ncbi:hypothetical protein MK526_00710 [Abiotrophia defectiva]|jgi:hypothetical protein|uniref:hypothetical protein n=1 Tax=Abiotrophia defectiva TaxID=46125 RepID=UPI00227EA5AE|nr:hypothetical protein [Abiotrophia defectiva]MCY7224278.1 hypothetical protein [Abiotrophia defectiva]
MQVNRSVSNQQRWLLECQLVYLLFRLSPILFGSAIFSWLSQTILGHLLLEEAIFLLPLVLTWLGYKSKQAWCHYLASAVNAGIVIYTLLSFNFQSLLAFSPLIALSNLIPKLFVSVVPMVYCAYQQFLVGRQLNKQGNQLKLVPTEGNKALNRVFLGYLFIKGWQMLILHLNYSHEPLYLLVIILCLATTYLAWWGYRHHRPDLLKRAWNLDLVYLLMAILFLIVYRIALLVIGAMIFQFLNQARDSEILANVIFSLGLSALLLIGLPTLPLFFLRKLKAGVQDYVFGVTSRYQGAEAYQLQDLDQVLTQAETLKGQLIECRMTTNEKGFLGQVGDAYWFTFSQSTGGESSAKVLRVRVQGKVPQAISSWQGVLTLRGQVGYHETDNQTIPNGWFLDADWLAFVPDKN